MPTSTTSMPILEDGATTQWQWRDGRRTMTMPRVKHRIPRLSRARRLRVPRRVKRVFSGGEKRMKKVVRAGEQHVKGMWRSVKRNVK